MIVETLFIFNYDSTVFIFVVSNLNSCYTANEVMVLLHMLQYVEILYMIVFILNSDSILFIFVLRSNLNSCCTANKEIMVL
jgi:hypothetical protein